MTQKDHAFMRQGKTNRKFLQGPWLMSLSDPHLRLSHSRRWWQREILDGYDELWRCLGAAAKKMKSRTKWAKQWRDSEHRWQRSTKKGHWELLTFDWARSRWRRIWWKCCKQLFCFCLCVCISTDFSRMLPPVDMHKSTVISNKHRCHRDVDACTTCRCTSTCRITWQMCTTPHDVYRKDTLPLCTTCIIIIITYVESRAQRAPVPGRSRSYLGACDQTTAILESRSCHKSRENSRNFHSLPHIYDFRANQQLGCSLRQYNRKRPALILDLLESVKLVVDIYFVVVCILPHNFRLATKKVLGCFLLTSN